MAEEARVRNVLRSALKSTTYVVAHTFVAVVILLATRFVAILLTRLGDPKLFDIVPMRYFFDAMDTVILLTFVVTGSFAAYQAFRE